MSQAEGRRQSIPTFSRVAVTQESKLSLARQLCWQTAMSKAGHGCIRERPTLPAAGGVSASPPPESLPAKNIYDFIRISLGEGDPSKRDRKSKTERFNRVKI